MNLGKWLRLSAALGLLLALSGCAGVYRVDNQVESFAQWREGAAPASAPQAIPAAPQTYRFERLPSQSAGASGASQDALEQWAQNALLPFGWSRAASADQTAWRVQVSGISTQLPYSPWERPWERDDFDWMGQVWVGMGVGHGQVMVNPWAMHNVRPYYQRQVALVIRDAASGRVVYETRANHDGRWNSTPSLWQAMMSAALTGFPAPPTGVRQVDLDVAR